MRRHTLLVALWVAFGLVWLASAAGAEQAKLHRLGPQQAFLQTLRELGYVEGKNITIEASNEASQSRHVRVESAKCSVTDFGYRRN
jgi:hypothetical protein